MSLSTHKNLQGNMGGAAPTTQKSHKNAEEWITVIYIYK